MSFQNFFIISLVIKKGVVAIKRNTIIGLVLSGVMFFNGQAFAAQSAENIEYVPASAPVMIQNKITLTGEEINRDSKLIDAEVTIPKISGLRDEQWQEQLNSAIKNLALKDINNLEHDAQEFAAEAEKNGWKFRPYPLVINYELKSNDRILSFVVNTYYSYGNSGYVRVDSYNIDTVHNKLLKLKDLFKPDADYKTAINSEIKKQIELQKKQGVYYFEGEEGFKTISDYQSFYLDGTNLVMVFPKYSIAPGYIGTPEFEIPLTVLDDIMQDVKVSDETHLQTVPLRTAAEKLGYTVKWHSDRNIELIKDNQQIKIKVGENSCVFAQEESFDLEAAPELKNNTVYVPLSFVENILKAKVTVDQNNEVNTTADIK